MLSLFSSKILHISFLIFSVSLAVLLHVARPSSLYSPMFIPNFSSCESMYSPTSSHVSAPSKDPIVTMGSFDGADVTMGSRVTYQKLSRSCPGICRTGGET